MKSRQARRKGVELSTIFLPHDLSSRDFSTSLKVLYLGEITHSKCDYRLWIF